MAHGLCQPCYNRQRDSRIITCLGCGEDKPLLAMGFCESCYRKQLKEQRRDEQEQVNNFFGVMDAVDALTTEVL